MREVDLEHIPASYLPADRHIARLRASKGDDRSTGLDSVALQGAQGIRKLTVRDKAVLSRFRTELPCRSLCEELSQRGDSPVAIGGESFAERGFNGGGCEHQVSGNNEGRMPGEHEGVARRRVEEGEGTWYATNDNAEAHYKPHDGADDDEPEQEALVALGALRVFSCERLETLPVQRCIDAGDNEGEEPEVVCDEGNDVHDLLARNNN